MNDKYDERQVILRLQDPVTVRQAFGCVVNEYSEQLYWQIRRMILDHEDANDVLQNTFLKAWGSIEYFRGDAKLSTWLYRIAFNECLTFLNKRKAEERCSLDTSDASDLRRLESDSYFNGNQVQTLLQEAILTLPEKQRMVFNMKYFGDKKYEEMSEVFGTSVGALKASYHHAVKKIEKYIQDHF